MKVPPKPGASFEKPLTYDKDRTLTRRTIAGAAGGLKGVDYQEAHTEAQHTENAARDRAAQQARPDAPAAPGAQLPATHVEGSSDPTPSATDRSRFVQEEEVRPKTVPKRKSRFAPRDRLTVDKDAPEHRRKRRVDDDEETDETEDPGEGSVELVEWSDGVESGGPSVARAHLFREAPEGPQPGDPKLFDPARAREVLGSPLAFAKHAMILAEAYRRSTGANRAEAVDYLARLFAGTGEGNFGRLALKEFGPSSGILDIYPLEVVAHVLEQCPGFLPKVAFGTFFSREGAALPMLVARPGEALRLEYADELKVRGFAIQGGGRPGYTFEPAMEPGTYLLTFQTPGRFRCLVSALSRTGQTVVERLEVRVLGEARADPEAYPARDAVKVAAWPKPPRLAADPPARPSVPTPPPSASTPGLGKGELFALKGRELEKNIRSRPRVAVPFAEVDERDAPIAFDAGAEARTRKAAPRASTPTTRPGIMGLEPNPANTRDTDAGLAQTPGDARVIGEAPDTDAGIRGAVASTETEPEPAPQPEPAETGHDSATPRDAVPEAPSEDRTDATPLPSSPASLPPRPTPGPRASSRPGRAPQPSPAAARTPLPAPARRPRPSVAPGPSALTPPPPRPSLPPPEPFEPLVSRPGASPPASLRPSVAPPPGAPPSPESPTPVAPEPLGSIGPRQAGAASGPAERGSGFGPSLAAAPATAVRWVGPRAPLTEAPRAEAVEHEARPIASGVAPSSPRAGVEIAAELAAPTPSFAALVADMIEPEEPALLLESDFVEMPAFVREVRPAQPLFDDDEDEATPAATPAATGPTQPPGPRPIRGLDDPD